MTFIYIIIGLLLLVTLIISFILIVYLNPEWIQKSPDTLLENKRKQNVKEIEKDKNNWRNQKP